MEKRWEYRVDETTAADCAADVASLARAINVGDALGTLLYQRGIRTYAEAEAFFCPGLAHLHDPFLMRDMDRAVDRLQRAVQGRERIVVYGDYDVDGTTSVALVYGFLRSLHPDLPLDYYIPDRYVEGYGVSRTGIDWAHAQGATLIICLDCGIKSAALVAYARQLGMDFIICDHHRPDDALPEAAAVLDPKRPDCHYPYKELSACGVGFKFMQAYCQRTGVPPACLYPYLDLVVVSIGADIVAMTGENRTLAHYGMQQLNTNPRPGLKALMQVAAYKSYRTVQSVVFGLGPRINAAGRIAHAHAAVALLLAADEVAATDLATQVGVHNKTRQGLDAGHTQQALAMIEADATLRAAKSTVLFRPDWSKGVVGIVASRCIEKYHRPTIILTESHERAAGSARSVPGFDVYEAIQECQDLLEQFGGHTYAAGLTMKLENVPAFQRRFEEVVARRILPEQLIPRVAVDLKLNLAQVTPRFFNVIRRMEPFGPDNLQPTFASENVTLRAQPLVLKGQHLKLRVGQPGTPTVECIGFGMADFAPLLTDLPFHICYQITENDYQGNVSLQLQLRDIKVA